MMTAALPQLEVAVLAQVLFASPVQPSECPSPAAIRTAIEIQFGACHGDVAACLAVVAQEAGDRPDLYAARIQWAQRSVAMAHLDRVTESPAGITG